MSKAKPRRPLLIELDATPGSSIGKFAPHEAAKFLSRIRVLCGSDGRPLPGMDLVEDKAMLEALVPIFMEGLTGFCDVE